MFYIISVINYMFPSILKGIIKQVVIECLVMDLVQQKFKLFLILAEELGSILMSSSTVNILAKNPYLCPCLPKSKTHIFPFSRGTINL